MPRAAGASVTPRAPPHGPRGARARAVRPRGERRGQRRGRGLGGVAASAIARSRCRARASRRRVGRGRRRRLVPARVRGQQERRRQLVAGRLASRLLLGLGGQAPRLRPQLGEDVLDPGEVRLGLGELVLGLPPAALVAPDAGDLLEQRPSLLRAQGEGLVDHALADEQERVVGEVRGIEQVDEVAQADPLLVQQVLVLARAIQPPAELEDLEVDRQQAVRVVEDEGDVGHALGRALLRPGPDDVLGLARCAAPGPARRAPSAGRRRGCSCPIRSGPTTALMPGAELDDRPLGERLEALEPAGARSRGAAGRSRAGREPWPVMRRPTPARGSRRAAAPSASAAAARLGDPPRRPLADAEHDAVDPTSIRNDFSWSGPVASTTGTSAGRRTPLRVFLQAGSSGS